MQNDMKERIFKGQKKKTKLENVLLKKASHIHTGSYVKMCVEAFSPLKHFPYCLFSVFSIKDLEIPSSFRVIIASLGGFSFPTDAVVSNL